MKGYSSPWVTDPLILHQQAQADHWRIVEISSREEFQYGHIAGAKFLPWQAIMHNGPPSPGLLPDTEQIETVLRYLQHSADCHYWVYDNEGGGWAGRFLWLLETIGHPLKTYIDGGKRAWQAAGLPLQVGAPSAATAPASIAPIQVDTAELVSADELLQDFAGTEPPVIWDARSAKEYLGQTPTAHRNGHMPGAIHCEWTELMDPNNGYRIRSDAQDYLASKGLTKDKAIVTHCQSHHRSGFTYLVGKALDMNIRAYAGAWTEWGNRPDTPIVSAPPTDHAGG